jgi:hypothetical protein
VRHRHGAVNAGFVCLTSWSAASTPLLPVAADPCVPLPRPPPLRLIIWAMSKSAALHVRECGGKGVCVRAFKAAS